MSSKSHLQALASVYQMFNINQDVSDSLTKLEGETK